jgi:hypothetical protein
VRRGEHATGEPGGGQRGPGHLPRGHRGHGHGHHQEPRERRPVRLRRRRHLLRRLGGGQGARTRRLHRPQGPGGLLRILALRIRSLRGLYLAEVIQHSIPPARARPSLHVTLPQDTARAFEPPQRFLPLLLRVPQKSTRSRQRPYSLLLGSFQTRGKNRTKGPITE